MGAVGVLPDGDPPVRAETLHESGRTRVTRLFLPGRTVIRKEPLGPDAVGRLEHERAMLERLRGVDGVAQVVDAPRYSDSIVLADVGGTSTVALVKPLAVDDLIRLAVALARAVAGMHRRGVMHRDITPANIVLSRDCVPCLVDFALAASVAEMRPEFTHHRELVGTLAYLAPEQSGRTGRPVDQRADLYALGATLYELATGGPPFGTGDPLRLTHDHIARVPVAPAQRNPELPVPLSEILLHLLEKEPDHRYQTAEGLLHDLQRLLNGGSYLPPPDLKVGERDFPLRLASPSRLVGRDEDVAVLEAAVDGALAGHCRGVLVTGAPGVGKTALVDQLRPVVTGHNGWFVAGKFDPYRRDLEFDAVNQAFRALSRLLLAEPEDELVEVRRRLAQGVGPNAGLLAAVVPEFAVLLRAPPDAGDPLTRAARLPRSGVEVLRAVASRKRPVVLFVDDLQWAGRIPLGFLDLVLSERPIEGLLLVGAYRDGDVDAAHPLAAPLSRWRDHANVQLLRLDNLPARRVAAMVAEMLHVDRAAAAELVDVINPYTHGNPYDVVELLNALRLSRALTATAGGWRWDAAAVRAHLSRSDVSGLLAARLEGMPAPLQQMVEAMACLGGRVEVSVLGIATDVPAAVVDQRLAPAVAEGLLVVEPGTNQAVRFRHDRIREVVLGRLDPPRRRTLQLTMARRLAGASELFAVAAEQYLPGVDEVDDQAERRQVVGLLRRAADQAGLIGDHALETALLTAALRLVDPGDTATLVTVHTARHAALYSLGRLDEADVDFRTVEGLCATPMDRAAAICVQVHSLTHRNRFAEALRTAFDSLRDLGIVIPAADRVSAELDHQFDYLYRWLDRTDGADELSVPDLSKPTLLAASRLINAVLPAAYVADPALYAWLSLETLRIWLEHGPGRTLLGPASIAAFAAVALRSDYAAGYRAARRILALSEARGYEPETSHARFEFALLACWFEPIEVATAEAQRAREGLIAGGDLANAGYTYQTAAQYLWDCAPSLDVYVADVEAGLAFVRRTGSEQIAQWLDSHRWLAGVLRGERPAAARETVLTERYADNPLAMCFAHIDHGIAAAVFGDPAGLARHSAAAMPLLAAVPGHYPVAVARLLRGLALARQAGAGDAAVSELDEVMGWLAERAADAPENFLHLLRLVEAERAWAMGEFRVAVGAFDAARGAVAGRQRPWHRALIAERAARFYLAHGIEHTGYGLLAEAHREYLAWGATAKVAQLDWAYPSLRPTVGAASVRPGEPPPERAAVTAGTIDLLGILSASQVLSSETGIDGLHARVVEVLGAMAGATGVHLVLWSADRQDWLLPSGGSSGVPVRPDGHEQAVPMAVLRYVRRTGEPVVVADATRDDRFSRDPYFADLACCSLLAVPILSRGRVRAVLVLENRLIRAAFTSDRLDAVTIIAGQLAVSLDNAQLYAELTTSRARVVATADQTRRRIERDLHDGAQQRLVSLALLARTARAKVPPDAGELGARLDDLAGGLTGALDDLRELARGIHPAVLAQGGLRPALKSLARRSGVPVEVEVQVDGRLPERVETAAYYLVAEALTNTAKHAEASVACVDVHTEPDPHEAVPGHLLRVSVRDDGRGGARLDGGTGLLGLSDRVETLGGRLRIQSPAGAGTTVEAELPLGPPRAGAP